MFTPAAIPLSCRSGALPRKLAVDAVVVEIVVCSHVLHCSLEKLLHQSGFSFRFIWQPLPAAWANDGKRSALDVGVVEVVELGSVLHSILENLLHNEKSPFVGLRPSPGPGESIYPAGLLTHADPVSVLHARLCQSLFEIGLHVGSISFQGVRQTLPSTVGIHIASICSRIRPSLSAMHRRRDRWGE